MNIDKRLLQLREQYRRDTNINPPVGVLGKATGEIADRSIPGNVFAREWVGDRYSTPKSYPNALPDSTRLYAGMAVELGWKNGQRAVTDKDRQGMLTAGDNPAPPPSLYTDPKSITTFLVKPTEPPSMYVQVLGGSFVIGSTTYTVSSTNGISMPHVNLTSIEAGLSAGQHCYAVVYLLATYAGYEVKASTGISALLPLTDADIDTCHALKTAGSIAQWAIEVKKGQTLFDNNSVYVLPSKDLRSTGNPGSASGTVTNVATGTGLSGGTITTTGTLIATPVFKQPARVVSTTNINISSPGATIDGVTMATDDRVLLTGQSTASQNGLWVWNSAAVPMFRPSDFVNGSTALAFFNIFVYIYAGSASNIGSLWRLTTATTVVIDTSSQAWAQVTININSTGAATKALDNLAAVAINTSLISDTDNMDDLGSAAKRWANTYSVKMIGDLAGRRIRNGSGATANAGDVGYVEYDATYGLVYKTTTTAKLVADWCAVIIGAANGSDIYITKSGPMVLNYTGTAPAAGEFLTLSTSAGLVSTNALMRHEVVAIATAAGSGGTVAAKLLMGTQFKSQANPNDVWTVFSQSDTLWTGTINGAPSATSVTVTTSTGNLNCFKRQLTTQLAQSRLHNTTRGTYRLVTNVNTGTNVVTTVSTSDAWATTDVVTIESRTITSGLAHKYIDLDFKTVIDAVTLPVLMRSIVMSTFVNDTSTTAFAALSLHPFDTYASSKAAGVNSIPVAGAYGVVTAIVPLINQTMGIYVDATGAATATASIKLVGYNLAIE